MRFEKLDLNLLVALDVLIDERSVSEAAKRLHLSQPAVSGALNRLREFFGDELLVQSGRQMVLTSKADELAAPVREALMLIRTRITTPARFEPSSAERNFKIIASDYVFAVVLADALADLASSAPGLSFEILTPETRTLELLHRGEADLLITIETHVSEHLPSLKLFEDNYAVICWSESKYCTGLGVEDYSSAGHAVSYFGPARTQGYSEIAIEKLGVERNVEMRVPSFAMLPQAVIGTHRLATVQRRYAEHWARLLPISILPLPIEIASITEVAQWHPVREKDAGLSWLVATIRDAARRLDDSSAPPGL